MWLVKQVARRSRRSDWRGYFLIGCVVILALLLAGASWSAYRSAQERTIAEDRRDHTSQVLLETGKLRTATLQQVRGERGFLLTGNDRFLEPYFDGLEQSERSLWQLRHLTTENVAQRERISRLQSGIAELDSVFSTMINQERTGLHDEAVYYVKLGTGRNAIEQIMRELDGIEQIERELLAERTAISVRQSISNERYQYMLAAVGLILLFLSILATIFVRRALDAETEARRLLQRFASTDALTGLANRRSFMEALGRSIKRTDGDADKTMCLAIFDIDHFKRINDRYGHPAGDEVIREVAHRALASLRKRDLVARIGGEEFAVILPAADLETAKSACERLRTAFAGKPLVRNGAIIPFTTSIGITECQSGDDIDHLMARADAALYEAKTSGRDQIRLAA